MPQPPVPSTSHHSALDSLLERVIPYEEVGAVVPLNLLQFGLLGSGVVIVTGLLALALPGAESIRHSGFYWVLGNTVASLVTFMRTLAGPAIVLGVALLVLDAFLFVVRTSARWRSIIVLQAMVGGLGGVLATAFLALLILNLAIWITLFVLGAALVLMLLVALASGG